MASLIEEGQEFLPWDFYLIYSLVVPASIIAGKAVITVFGRIQLRSSGYLIKKRGWWITMRLDLGMTSHIVNDHLFLLVLAISSIAHSKANCTLKIR